MLYIVGLGLNDEKDISLKALEILRKTDRIFAEFYTSTYSGRVEDIERLIGRKIVVLEREDIEENSENLLRDALERDIVLLVPGDPMVATTHTALVLNAKKLGIGTRIIHSSSIYSAIAETGLQIYKFGKTTTIPFPEGDYFPISPYNTLKDNLNMGMHTLLLLDIKMTINQAIEILFEMENRKSKGIFSKETLCVGVARLGGNDHIIKFGKAKNLQRYDFGNPPHSLVVPGKLHFMEEEFLAMFRL